MKAYGGILHSYTKLKKKTTELQRLHTAWSQLQDTLKKPNHWDSKEKLSIQGLEGGYGQTGRTQDF